MASKTSAQNDHIKVIFHLLLLHPERHMIGFESDEEILQKLRERLRSMTDEELIKFGKDARKLAENPFQKQLEEARQEWKPRNQLPDSKNK